MKELTGSFEHVLAVAGSTSFKEEITAGIIILGITIMSGIIGFIFRRLFAKVDKNDKIGTENSEKILALEKNHQDISEDFKTIKESIQDIKTEQAVQKESSKNINDKLDSLLDFNTTFKENIDDKFDKLNESHTSFKDTIDDKFGKIHARITKVQGAD